MGLVAGIITFAGTRSLWGILSYPLWVVLDSHEEIARPMRPVWLVLLSGREEPGEGKRDTELPEGHETQFAESRIGGG